MFWVTIFTGGAIAEFGEAFRLFCGEAQRRRKHKGGKHEGGKHEGDGNDRSGSGKVGE
jgi:hypothetical protein